MDLKQLSEVLRRRGFDPTLRSDETELFESEPNRRTPTLAELLNVELSSREPLLSDEGTPVRSLSYRRLFFDVGRHCIAVTVWWRYILMPAHPQSFRRLVRLAQELGRLVGSQRPALLIPDDWLEAILLSYVASWDEVESFVVKTYGQPGRSTSDLLSWNGPMATLQRHLQIPMKHLKEVKMSSPEKPHWRTRLLHSQVDVPDGFDSLAAPTYRGSTVRFRSMAEVHDTWHAEKGYAYGIYGTPTTLELGARIAELEGADHTFIVPGGQAAISLVYLAFCESGSHALVPDNAYHPNVAFAQGLLKKFGVEVEVYDPALGAEIEGKIRAHTALIWCESPGSVTMEVQDVPAIVKAARERGVPVALDNTYAAGVLFDAFAHGVDVSVQALTKYIGGHSDLLLGSVSVRNKRLREQVGDTLAQLGSGVSPDDCSLALRGLKTLGIRLAHLEAATLKVARWLQCRPEVERVLHPALPDAPGHQLWRRDFTGSASVFSFILTPDWSVERVARFVDSLQLFSLGFSWGGASSLVMAYPELDRNFGQATGRLVRLNIGLEEPDDLIADLYRSFGW